MTDATHKNSIVVKEQKKIMERKESKQSMEDWKRG